MKQLTSIIIGAGQCGLAMSQRLTSHSVDHLILERGEIGNAWRKDRWESLRLLTPNWMGALPGAPYRGKDPEGYMSMSEVTGMFDRYARDKDLPVQTGVTVKRVAPFGDGYIVETNQGPFHSRNVVLATGACNRPAIPACGADVPRNVRTVTPFDYKRPDDLPEGRILVVGGSATGVQLARELQLSGREVILSVGEHVRAPRRYRGRDIKWWMNATGLLDQHIDDVDDVARVRRTPSLQLAGMTADVDLNALQSIGVRIAGRFSGIREGKALFSGALANVCAMADLKQNRMLALIDEWAAENGLEAELPPADRPEPTHVPEPPLLEVNLSDGTVAGIVWATGFRPDHSWLDAPVFDRRGRLTHAGGVVAPGLYAMGLPFLRRRKSTLIAGAGDDARDLADHMMARLSRNAA